MTDAKPQSSPLTGRESLKIAEGILNRYEEWNPPRPPIDRGIADCGATDTAQPMRVAGEMLQGNLARERAEKLEKVKALLREIDDIDSRITRLKLVGFMIPTKPLRGKE